MTFIAIITLTLLAILFRIQSKRWTTPGAFFAGYWTVAVICALLLAPNGYPVSAGSIWWITASVLCLGIGSMLGSYKVNSYPINFEYNAQITQINLKNLQKLVIIFSCIGMVGVHILLVSLGLNFSLFFSLETLQRIAPSVAESRYNENFTPPAIVTLAMSFNYASAYLGGMLRTFKKTMWAFATFFPVLLTTLIMTTKAGLIFTIFLWLAGWLSMRIRLGKTDLPLRYILNIGLIGAIISSLFIASSLLRYKIHNLSELGYVYEKLTVYYIGYLSGFSQWFSQSGYQSQELGFGQYTFAGLFDVLGLQTRQQGIFSSTVAVGDYQTNIYTLFRYLIMDFGLVGSLLLLVIIGFLASYFYEKTRSGSYLALPFLMMFYAQVLFSNTTTVYGYNTMIFSWVIVAIYLAKNSFVLRKKLVKFNRELETY